MMERINHERQMLKNGMIERPKSHRPRIENHPVFWRQLTEKSSTILKHGGDEKVLLSSIAKSTRRLVSKQRKWFRKYFASSSRFQLIHKKDSVG